MWCSFLNLISEKHTNKLGPSIKKLTVFDILYLLNFDLRQIYIKYIFGNPELPMLLKVISTVYPQLTDLTRKLNFLLSFLKSTCSIYNLKTKLRTFPSISRVIRSKFEANRSRGSWVKIRQTNRQTNRDYNFIYI